mmetsp:Transcript_25188/g.18976  ORF Transcript_25188/g.18976 Transcript_25188/m.18976 type:complete len:82 (-) Transcript_25188:727-972(-)
MVRDPSEGILPVLEYYKEFNRAQEYMNEGNLLMLEYFAKFGDENVKCFHFRQVHASKALSKELIEREQHKYDIYERLASIC